MKWNCSRLCGCTLWTLGPYDGLLRKAISTVKTQGHKALGRELSEIASSLVKSRLVQKISPDYVMAVPSSHQGQRFRGFSLPQMMEDRILEVTDWVALPQSLRRAFKSANKSSRGLSKEDRITRSKSLVQRTETLVCGSILIVDDVVTTGSTLNRCVEQAQGLGFQEVTCLALAELVAD